MKKRVRSAAARAALGCALLAPTACDEPLSAVEAIDKTRVVGARVEVNGEPSRAAPLAGENVVVRFFVLSPDPAPALAYELEACMASDSASDLTTCAGEPLATAARLVPVNEPPSITFVAPAPARGDERLAVLGAVCSSGIGLPAEGATSCDDGSGVLRTTLDFSMDDGSHPNTNPALASVTFDSEELAAATALSTECAELPGFAGGIKHRLTIAVEPSSRDALRRETELDPTRESLLFSYFVTRGDVDHAWSALDANDAADTTGVIWTAPEVSAPSLARFAVVVRDGRGGSDFAERRICILPR